MLVEQGYANINQFRQANQYDSTQKLFESLGLTEEVENKTPTVGVNIVHLAQMKSVQALSSEAMGQALKVAILGISTVEGPRDFQRLLKGLGAQKVSTVAIDLADGIFDKIRQSGLDEVDCLQKDARETGLPDKSQDFVLRDHLGNCCPPEIDRAINQEVARITKPRGIAIVNITTSELLAESQGRSLIPFDRLINEVGEEVVKAFQTHVYDLEDLKREFPDFNAESLRGVVIEIEPGGSFVVFGEDEQGHGEWFRPLADHLISWRENGFNLVEMKSREGWDSHNPPLRCQRHNVVLRRSEDSSVKN